MKSQQPRRASTGASAVDDSALNLNRRVLDANKSGDTRGALAFFLQATALQPNHVPYILSAANMMLKLGQSAAAVELYKAIIADWMASAESAAIHDDRKY